MWALNPSKDHGSSVEGLWTRGETYYTSTYEAEYVYPRRQD